VSPRGAPVTVGADAFRIRFGYWIDRVRAGQEVLVTRRGKSVIRLTPVAPASAAPADPVAAAPAATTLPSMASLLLFPPATAAGSL
jgi:prevent-host-death family protein